MSEYEISLQNSRQTIVIALEFLYSTLKVAVVNDANFYVFSAKKKNSEKNLNVSSHSLAGLKEIHKSIFAQCFRGKSSNVVKTCVELW